MDSYLEKVFLRRGVLCDGSYAAMRENERFGYVLEHSNRNHLCSVQRLLYDSSICTLYFLYTLFNKYIYVLVI